nr:hypothetical protein [Brevibacillus brevis]
MKLVAIHMVDLMRYLFGEVWQVSGFSNNDNRGIANTLSLQFENGVVGSVYFAGMSHGHGKAKVCSLRLITDMCEQTISKRSRFISRRHRMLHRGNH